MRKYGTNSFLGLIQEERQQQIDSRDQRNERRLPTNNSSRKSRRVKQPSYLPNILDNSYNIPLDTEKSEPFRWWKPEENAIPQHIAIEEDEVPKKNNYAKSRSLHRPLPYAIYSDPSAKQRNERIANADRLERQLIQPKNKRKLRQLKRTEPVRHHVTSIKQRRIHPRTITDSEQIEQSRQPTHRELMDEPLTFGILSPDEQDEETPILSTQHHLNSLYLSIPAVPEHRREESVRDFCYRLYRVNPLFRKLQYLTCVQMICQCQVFNLEPGKTLYDEQTEYSCSYIILWGTAEIYSDEILQGSYEPGNTLCQQYLLIGDMKKIGERAKAGRRGLGILELTHGRLTTIRSNLSRVFLKKDLLTLEAVFKKNFFNKKSIRNSFKLKRDR